jgi:hypothetical protein
MNRVGGADRVGVAEPVERRLALGHGGPAHVHVGALVGVLTMAANVARQETKSVQGWPKLWGNFRDLIGIFSQSVGPNPQFGPTLCSFRFRAPADPYATGGCVAAGPHRWLRCAGQAEAVAQGVVDFGARAGLAANAGVLPGPETAVLGC